MTPAKRYFPGCTHIAVLGLGVMLGLPGSPIRIMPELSSGVDLTTTTNPTPAAQGDGGEFSSASGAPLTTADYAAAWDSLKGRFLPRQERLLIEKTLLEEWSVIDLAAAVRAVFAETRDDGPSGFGKVGIISLLDCCAPGIRADPLAAWELVRTRAFGMETGRFRRQWLECMTETHPVQVFSILAELPKGERLSTLASLAEASSSADDPATRMAIWNQLSALPDTPADQEFIHRVGETICYYTPPAEVVERLLGETTSAGRKICISALSLALFEVVENEDFPKPLFLLPTAIRGEVAAASLKHGVGNEDRALILANIALDSGNFDALQAAAADPAFARFAKEMDQPLALAQWALRLPEDPCTAEIFRQSIAGAAYSDFEAIQATLHALPEGWQRDQGLAALSKVKQQRDAEAEEE
jgi:hypothetical protein